jgi:hypothetical protein
MSAINAMKVVLNAPHLIQEIALLAWLPSFTKLQGIFHAFPQLSVLKDARNA